MSRLRAALPLVMLVLAGIVLFSSGALDRLHPEQLVMHQAQLRADIDSAPWLSRLTFIGLLTLAMSTADDQGFNSAALSIADSLGGALALSTTGLVFAMSSFAGVFAFTAVIALLAIAIAPRVAGGIPDVVAGAPLPDGNASPSST